jgi:hypothetical protein
LWRIVSVELAAAVKVAPLFNLTAFAAPVLLNTERAAEK